MDDCTAYFVSILNYELKMFMNSTERVISIAIDIFISKAKTAWGIHEVHDCTTLGSSVDLHLFTQQREMEQRGQSVVFKSVVFKSVVLISLLSISPHCGRMCNFLYSCGLLRCRLKILSTVMIAVYL